MVSRGFLSELMSEATRERGTRLGTLRSADEDALGITKCAGSIYKYIFRNAGCRGEMIDDFIVNAILKIPASALAAAMKLSRRAGVRRDPTEKWLPSRRGRKLLIICRAKKRALMRAMEKSVDNGSHCTVRLLHSVHLIRSAISIRISAVRGN